MSAPGALLEHLGVVYGEPESLVESAGPRVARAVDDGDDVYLVVDRRTARGFRDWLGPAADRVEFPSPMGWPGELVRGLRSIVHDDRRTLVLGQYTAAGVVGEEHGEAEDAINLVLGDLPLTLLCTCARDASASLLACVHTGHPDLLVDGAVLPNPDYRAPAAARPVSAAVWGPATLRLDFRAPADLHRIREHVTRAAEDLGLRGDTVREAVQAAHEAAVLAAGGPDPVVLALAGADDHGDDGRTVPCVLEVRSRAGSLHCEVTGPRPESLPRPAAADDDPLRIVRLFSDRALLHDDADTRSVRVLSVPD